eukprot:s1200_g4.t1
MKKFVSDSKKHGILLKTFLVLFSFAGGINVGLEDLKDLSFHLPATFGRPKFEGIWDERAGSWKFKGSSYECGQATRSTFTDSRSTFPDSSSTFPDSSSTFPDSSSTFPVARSGPQMPRTSARVYLFEKMDKQSWLSDLEGQSAVMSKGERSNIIQHLRKLAGNEDRVRCTPNLAKVIDLAAGWDYQIPQHRREALRLLATHRPAMIWLSAHDGFAVKLADIQIDGGRGFCLAACSITSPSHTVADSLAKRKDVATVCLNLPKLFGEDIGEAPKGVLWTNVMPVATALQRRCQAVRHTPPDREATTTTVKQAWKQQYLQQFLDQLHQLQPLQHFPIFNIQDQWFRRGVHLRCQHFVPRRHPALPRECKAFQVTGLRFTGRRTACRQFVDGHTQLLHDDWKQPSLSHNPTATAWTGYTEFEVLPSMLLPDAYQASAQWTAKAAAHALFTYVLQETAFQTEWASMFPSHRILGERGARGAGVSDFDFDADASEFDLDAFIDDIPHATEAPTAKPKRSPGEDEKAVERELRDLPVPSRHEVPISSLPPDLRREVYRIHRNLGHPERAAFCRALKRAGAKPEVIQYAKHVFQCPICFFQIWNQFRKCPVHLSYRRKPPPECLP